MLAAHCDIAPEDAFTVLRSHARARNMRLTGLCREVVTGTVDLTSIVRPAP